jgi:uncharacterized membrane-anchored protein YhcB (DUF1043 family)
MAHGEKYMNQFAFAVLCLVAGAVLGQIIRSIHVSLKLREQAAKDAVASEFKYAHSRLEQMRASLQEDLKSLYDHFHGRLNSTENSIDAHAHLLESHAKQLAGDVKGDVKAAGKKI